MKAALVQTPILTRVMTLLAWVTLSGAIACLVYPTPDDAVCLLLLGVAVLLGVRAPSSTALLGGLGLAALFCVLRTALEVARVDAGAAIDGPQALLASPALRDGGRWVASGLGAAMILGVLAPSTWISQALFGTPVFDLTRRRRTASDSGLEPGVIKRSNGRRRMEVELAKAARDLCEVSIALVGVDGANPAQASSVMAELDQLVLASLTPSDTVSVYGRWERLVVLPGVSASALYTGAVHLCAAATQRLGQQVRAAVATYPHDGSTVGYLLEDLELSLASCRALGTDVAAARDGSVTVNPITQTIGRR